MTKRDRAIQDLLAHSVWDDLADEHSSRTIGEVRKLLALAVSSSSSKKSETPVEKRSSTQRAPSAGRGATAKSLLLQTDGGSAGNPGPSGGGGILVAPDGELVESFSVYFGEATNNEAEYRALIEGLDRALELAPERLDIRIDSELLVKQIQGKYKVRKEHLKPLYERTMKRLARMKYTIAHVPRAQNADADALATRAIEENR